jgi:hypothetical protein
VARVRRIIKIFFMGGVQGYWVLSFEGKLIKSVGSCSWFLIFQSYPSRGTGKFTALI